MSMLDNLREARSTAAADAEALLAGEVSAETLDAAEARSTEIADLDSKIATAEALEARTAELKEARSTTAVPTFGSAVVTNEPKTYDERGANSFVRDMIFASTRNDQGSWSRLNRHMDEVRVENRAVGRTDGAIGEFVAPLWLLDAYAGQARAGLATASLFTQQELPANTDSISIPRITTGTSTAFQSADNATVSNTDMATSTVTAPVRTLAGYQDVSIQLLEQSGLSAGLDQLVFKDLIADSDRALNTAVLNNADGTSGTIQGVYNAAGTSVTWTEATPTGANGQKAIAQAISQIVSARFDRPDYIVVAPATWYWLASSVDSNGRPIVVPTANGPQNASGLVTDPGVAGGVAGSIHGISVVVDPTMALVSTTQSPIIVGKFSDSYLYSSAPKFLVAQDVLSGSLGVRFVMRKYVALAHRYAKSYATITGTGTVKQTGF